MYTLGQYGSMVADGARMRAYAGALAEVVRPGAVVVDIGAGHGVLSLIASKLGARRVFAIETSGVGLEVAREHARENGVEDRIEFIRADSRTVELLERADVVVSDLRGALPLFEDHFEVLDDARRRFLREGGAFLPKRDVLWGAVVSSAHEYEAHFGPGLAPHGVTLQAARARMENIPALEQDRLWTPEVLSESARWAELDYEAIEPKPVTGRLSLRATRGGIGHGVLLWFESVIWPGWGYVTGPTREPSDKTTYGRVLLPFATPLSIEPGDRVDVEIRIGPRGEPISWNVVATDGAGHEKARWRKSTFLATADRPVRLKAPVERAESGSVASPAGSADLGRWASE